MYDVVTAFCRGRKKGQVKGIGANKEEKSPDLGERWDEGCGSEGCLLFLLSAKKEEEKDTSNGISPAIKVGNLREDWEGGLSRQGIE